MRRILVAAACAVTASGCCISVCMPGHNASAKLPPLDTRETAYRGQLERDLTVLAKDIGPRDAVAHVDGLERAALFLTSSFAAAGYRADAEEFKTHSGQPVRNVFVEIRGITHPEKIVVIGAHYDSVNDGSGIPGADDNGSGTVALLALARTFATRHPERTLRFVAFTNEEPPFFRRDDMGSRVYASNCKKRGENITAMLSLESIGYYSDAPNSQKYPWPFSKIKPNVGNYLAFVSNTRSRLLLRRVVRHFRKHAHIPSDGAAAPAKIPGIDWSDQLGFWQAGYSAVMVTDTAPNRNPHYHEPSDTVDTIDFDRLARSVAGLEDVVADLSHTPAGTKP